MDGNSPQPQGDLASRFAAYQAGQNASAPPADLATRFSQYQQQQNAETEPEKPGFFQGAGEEATSIAKGMITPAVVQPIEQGISSLEAIPPVLSAYEKSRQSGKGIIESATAAQELAKQHDMTLQGLKGRFEEFSKNPSAAAGRAIVDAIAILTPLAVKGLGIKAPEASYAAAEAPAEATATVAGPSARGAGSVVQQALKSTRETAGAAVGQAKKVAYPAGTGVTLDQTSKLAQAAQQVLDETKGGEGFESLKTPETDTVRNLAQEILKNTKKGMRLDPDTVSKYTKQLDDKINSPSLQQSDIGRYKLIKKALSESEQEAVSKAQGSQAGENLGKTKKEFAQIATRQERGLSKAVVKTKAPEQIITKFAKGGPEKQSELTSVMKDLDADGKMALREGVLKQIKTANIKDGEVDWEGVNDTLTKKGDMGRVLLGDDYDKIMGDVHSKVIQQRQAARSAEFRKNVKTAAVKGAAGAVGAGAIYGLYREIFGQSQ